MEAWEALGCYGCCGLTGAIGRLPRIVGCSDWVVSAFPSGAWWKLSGPGHSLLTPQTSWYPRVLPHRLKTVALSMLWTFVLCCSVRQQGHGDSLSPLTEGPATPHPRAEASGVLQISGGTLPLCTQLAVGCGSACVVSVYTTRLLHSREDDGMMDVQLEKPSVCHLALARPCWLIPFWVPLEEYCAEPALEGLFLLNHGHVPDQISS